MAASQLTLGRALHQDDVVLQVGGELDLPGAVLLMREAKAVAVGSVSSVVWDLTGLSAAAALHLYTVFPAAQRRAGPWPHRTINLCGPSADLRRRLSALNVARYMPLHGPLQLALDAARVEKRSVHRHLDVLPGRSCAKQARLCVDSLVGSVPGDVPQRARLVVSELATNASLHTGSPFTVRLVLTAQDLLVAVSDRSAQEPRLQPMQASEPCGRGIQIVEALSSEWGVRLIHQQGKTVWARLSTAA